MRYFIITGGAGFIGSHLIEHLLHEPDVHLTCIDNFDNYYEPALKWQNLMGVLSHERFRLIQSDIGATDKLYTELAGINYEAIIHLAAKAGVRRSIEMASAYYEVNVINTLKLLDLTRRLSIQTFVLASSSSVYGSNPNLPWREDDLDLRPMSPYAASKQSVEILGRTYSQLYGIRFRALRFFTVYGPRQRPDLAIQKFLTLMQEGKPLPIYGDGSTLRDYTHVSDVVAAIRAVVDYDKDGFRVFNIGNNRPVTVRQLIECIEDTTGLTARIAYLPPQPGDAPATHADITLARMELGYVPRVLLADGIRDFYEWTLKQENFLHQAA